MFGFLTLTNLCSTGLTKEETPMKKQLHIHVNGFDIYLGISKNLTQQEKELIKAYENQQLEKELEMMAAKAEYDMRRLSA